jgi:hypothetical protein
MGVELDLLVLPKRKNEHRFREWALAWGARHPHLFPLPPPNIWKEIRIEKGRKYTKY